MLQDQLIKHAKYGISKLENVLKHLEDTQKKFKIFVLMQLVRNILI